MLGLSLRVSALSWKHIALSEASARLLLRRGPADAASAIPGKRHLALVVPPWGLGFRVPQRILSAHMGDTNPNHI